MVIYLNGSFYPQRCHRVGTDALVCPPEHSNKKPHQVSQKGEMLPNGMPCKGK